MPGWNFVHAQDDVDTYILRMLKNTFAWRDPNGLSPEDINFVYRGVLEYISITHHKNTGKCERKTVIQYGYPVSRQVQMSL